MKQISSIAPIQPSERRNRLIHVLIFNSASPSHLGVQLQQPTFASSHSFSYNHYALFVCMYLLFVAMGFNTSQALSTLHALKLQVPSCYTTKLSGDNHVMRGGVLLAVSSHISLCSTLYTRVQRLAWPDQIFVHQSLTKLSL